MEAAPITSVPSSCHSSASMGQMTTEGKVKGSARVPHTARDIRISKFYLGVLKNIQQL